MARPRVSGRTSSAQMLMRLVATTYQAGAIGLFVAWMSQVMTNCVEPPKIETPTA